ncbi:MAG: hypothetical protein E7350_03875 [Clostridiales bacterium]|nr:hypothetical protein [Clostridiales bacterium]
MEIQMFNFWYFFWVLLGAGSIVGLYYLLRHRSTKTQKIVLFSLLAFGLFLHFLKVYIPPYSVDEARMLRDAWFVNICGANIALFPFLFFSKKNGVKDYMFYIGVLSGLIALVYPQEPLAKTDQAGEVLDIIRFYYHHWMLLAVPLLMVLFGHHRPSYKRVFSAPTGLMLLTLFIILNQIFQSELGYIPLRGDRFEIPNYKNTSWIWGPLNQDGSWDPIGKILAIFTPEFFTKVPVGAHAGEFKYWPWFWLIFPVYILVTPLAFAVSMIWDRKNFVEDMKNLPENSKKLWQRIMAWFGVKSAQPVALDEQGNQAEQESQD